MSWSRQLVVLAVAVISVLHVHEAEAKRRAALSGNIYTQGGYASRPSVEQGGSIGFHIATTVSPFSVRIINLAEPDRTLRTIGGLQSRTQDCGGRHSEGCGWELTTTLDVPRSWPSGYYAAVFPTFFGDRYLPFIVREDDPGSLSRTVVLVSTHTWQGYNEFGSRSTHPVNQNVTVTHVSYDRPYLTNQGLGRYLTFDKYFVDWMTKEERPFEVITDVDLEDPTILSRYDLVVIPGHAEYWTPAGRNNLEEFSRNGGHIAVLNGNTMWWQVRLENQNRTIAAYKGDPSDPAIGSPAASTHFFSHPVNNPENRLIGTSYRNGGSANRLNDQTSEMKPVAERTPWTVTDANHWIYNGTGLRTGDAFGRDTTGLEVDGVVFNCSAQGQVLGAEGSDGAPLNYEILAIVPASVGWGTLGFVVHPSGGAVFNAASQGWVWGLQGNDIVQRMTANVLDRLSTGAPQLYQPSTSTILAQDLFNCPQPLPAAGWESGPAHARPQMTAGCAYEGAAGLELAGNAPIAIARSITGGGASRTEAHVRLYLKADELRQRTAFPMTLVSLEERLGNALTRAAFIELDTNGGKRIRIARRPSAGGFVASNWIPLNDGWRLVEMTWRSPGTMTLQVDGGSPVSLENPDAGQRVNRVVISHSEPELTGEGRVCVDAFAIGSTKPGSVAPGQ
jgi:hypothetical protein